MAFIERLRQQKEVAALARSQQDSELAAAKQAEDYTQQQRDTQEREFHQQRRQEAEAFRQESGVGLLVVELGRFLIEERRADTILKQNSALIELPSPHTYSNIHGDEGFRERLGYTVAPLYDDWGYRSITYPSSISLSDKESVFDIVMWDFKNVVGQRECRDGTFDGAFSEAEQRFLAVETRPDGNIAFHAGWLGTGSIKESQWRGSNKKNDIFDKALEKAFKHPGTHRFKYRYVRNWHEAS